MDRHMADRRSNTLHNALSAGWGGKENLIGTLIDRHLVRLTGVGDYADDAIVVFLEALRNASNTTSIFGNMWKTIRDDKTIDMWLYDHEERWRSVSFEIQFQHTFPPDDLYMVVSTFVPMAIDEDPAHYPVEQSTAYIRGTQDLRAIVSMHAKRVVREVSQDVESNEQSSRVQHGNDKIWSSSASQGASYSRSSSGSQSYSYEQTTQSRPGWFQSSEESRSLSRNTSSSQQGYERRDDSSASNRSELSRSERHSSEGSWRSGSNYTTEDTVELTEDVSFMAVGPDFSQPERMLRAWRADPGNRESSKTIDMMLGALPYLGRMIEQGVSHRRMAERARSRVGQSEDFWTAAVPLIARDNQAAYGKRVVLTHDGYPRAIEPGDIAHAIQQMRRNLGQLTGRSHYLPGE